MKFWSSILVLFLFLSVTGCEDYKVVARVGNKPIYAGEFKKEFLAENTIKEGDTVPLQRKNAFLDIMIEKRQRLFDAYQSRCDTIPKFKQTLEKGEKRYIYDYVIQSQVVDKVISKKDYQDRYTRLSNQIRTRQIYLRFPFGKSREAKTQIYGKLDSLRQLINRGKDFDMLARQFSQDSLSAGKGGDLGFLQWDDKKYNDKFLNAIYDMKSTRGAQIIETDRGLHLVEIVQIRSVPVSSLEQLKPEILKNFYSEKRNELSKRYAEFIQEIEKKYNMRWNEENLNTLVSFIRAEIDSASKRGEKFDAVQINKEIPRDLELVKYNNGIYTSENYVDDVNKNYPMFFPGIYSAERIKSDIQRFTDRDIMIQYGYHHNFQHKPEIRARMEKLKQEQMIANVNKINIDNLLTDEECLQYYERNKEKYNKPARYKIQEIMVQDSILAETIYKRIKNGESIEALVNKYSERSETKTKKGVLGFFSEKQYGNIGLTAATMQVGQISRPVKNEQSYSVFKLLEKEEKEDKAFSELGGRNIKGLKAALGKEKANAWMEQLNKQYPVIKYETILDRLFNEKTM